MQLFGILAVYSMPVLFQCSVLSCGCEFSFRTCALFCLESLCLYSLPISLFHSSQSGLEKQGVDGKV